MDSLKTSILKVLYFLQFQSIAEISERVGKSIPVTTRAINELVEEGLIIENGLAASTGGRRAMNFALNNDTLGSIISVAIDQYAIYVVAYDIYNREVVETKNAAIHLWDDNDVYDKLTNILDEVIDYLGTHTILCIGITLPGFVDAQQGVNSSFEETSPFFKLKDNIKRHTGIRTYMENDSAAIAIAEHQFGTAKDVREALVINLNWGVGLGMIIKGELFRGHSGYAGEFSHIPLADETKLCSCGKMGCLEVEASLYCAVNDIQSSIENGEQSYLADVFQEKNILHFEDVVNAYERGDQLTIRAIKRIAHMLGKGIATLIHILNPEKIIISGRGATFGDTLIPQLQSSIQEFSIPRLSKQTTIQISEITNIQLLSSACIAIQQMQKLKMKKTQIN